MQLINLFPRQLRALLRPPRKTAKGTPPRARPKPAPRCKITGRHLGRILCEALGESPRNVHRIEVVADAREAAIVKITRFVSDSEAGIFGARMREFSLIEAGADE